jgi:CheY-like chemotaxis protein
VEVFPQHGGGLFTNRPLQTLQHTNQGSARGATPTNIVAAAAAPGDSSSSGAHAPPVAPPSPQVSALLLIEISDTGIGLTESNMNKLYSPFMQAQRLAGGTGLGLYSLSKRLDALGGHYGVECRKDGQPGSLFWFAIPYRQDEDASANFSRLQRSGSSRLQDLILSIQPSLAELMASDATGADAAEKGGSAKSVADSEPQAESAPHSLHCSTQSSLSLVTNTNSTRTSQGSIPPLSPSTASTFGIAQGLNNSPGHVPIASAAPPGILPTSGPMHFLLVDDSESILKVTSMLLVRSGHTVERAENGVIALEKLATSALPGGRLFDVVVMDLQMPVLDGLEATKRLRELEEERAIAVEAAAISAAVEEGKDGQEAAESAVARLRRQIVIGLSANGDDETMQEAYSAGVDRFIEKPFTIQKLLDALAEIRAEAAAP